MSFYSEQFFDDNLLDNENLLNDEINTNIYIKVIQRNDNNI